MRFISMPFSLLLLLYSLSLLHMFTCSHGGTATAQNLIYETCKACSQSDPNVNLGFCTSSLQAAPAASRCAGLFCLGKISIKLVQYNVTDNRCRVKQLLKMKLDPFVKGCLQDCLELYNDAISSAKQAMEQYKSKNYMDANTYLSSIMDDATTCEDGFMEREGQDQVVSPLTKRNNDTFQLSAMALSIMQMIWNGSHNS